MDAMYFFSMLVLFSEHECKSKPTTVTTQYATTLPLHSPAGGTKETKKKNHYNAYFLHSYKLLKPYTCMKKKSKTTPLLSMSFRTSVEFKGCRISG